METEWTELEMQELSPDKYENLDDYISENSSIDDILQRDVNFEHNADILKRTMGTIMTPVIDPRDTDEVHVIRWTLPCEDFYCID